MQARDPNPTATPLMSAHPTPEAALTSALVKATRRLVPFLLLLYVLAFLDRVNVGFAKVAMMADTGLSAAAYAFGAGLFFAGYALLEVPSNLILHRVGARRWLARIMVTWGLISAGMMFAWSETMFYTMRLLLGAAEAGFFPGVILYLTYWFPAAQRGRILGMFYFGAPLAFIFGGPVSGWLMEMNGWLGLRGWQWMFLIEGVLASVVGVWAYFYLTDRPAQAEWLAADEREALQSAVDSEESAKSTTGSHRVRDLLSDRGVLHLCLIYFLIQISVYGVVFALPSQVERLLGKSAGLQVGLVTAIPWVCALIAAYAVPRVVRGSRRKKGAVLVLLVAAIGLAVAGQPQAIVALSALCVAAAGFISVQPVFWTFPTERLSGAAAAGGIALINSVGNLGGFFAPSLREWAEQTFASGSAGMWVLAASTCLAAIAMSALKNNPPAMTLGK
jgi:sugar phosphate permease